MIDYGQIQLASPPLTGADWYVQACQLAGLGPAFHEKAFTPWESTEQSNALRFTLIRNPYNWLTAIFEAGEELNGHMLPFYSKNYNDYESFIESYLNNCPGALVELHRKYVADITHRFEDLPWSFIEVADLFGISPVLLDNIKRNNPKSTITRQLPRRLRLDILECEEEIFINYEYF